MNYKKMKKVELHVHLDGSVRVPTLAELAGITIEEANAKAVAPLKCHNLADYLTRFELPISVMQTKENLIRIASELAMDLKDENVIYAEIRFAPYQHTRILTLKEVVDAVLEGLSKVDLKTNLILSMMRNDPLEKNKQIIDLAKEYEDNGVVGVDLAGDEATYKTSFFEDLFAYAKEKGVKYTIHAGEADGEVSVADALRFGTKRIGHGIRIISSPQLMEYAKENDILLEICPTSNVQTNVVSEIKEHPINRLVHSGIKVCINTDNRTVSNTTLSDEYARLNRAFDYTEKDFMTFNINAINATSLTDEEKTSLINDLKSN